MKIGPCKSKKFFEKDNFGKLFLRLSIGSYFIASGVKYFAGGWIFLRSLGEIFKFLGLNFWPGFWGVVSATILILSGMSFLIGFFFRINCAILSLIFLLKTLVSWFLDKNYWNVEFLFNLNLFFILISFIFIGAGQFSADKE